MSRRPVVRYGNAAKPKQREADFQSDVLELLTLTGWKHHHETDSRKTAAGWPDIFACHPSRGVFWAELKVGRNKPSDAQWAWLNALEVAGERAFVWRPESWDEIVRVAQGLDR